MSLPVSVNTVNIVTAIVRAAIGKSVCKYKKGRHSCYSMHLHLVFVTKYRKAVFGPAHLEALLQVFTELCQRVEAELVEFNGEPDHVHLLLATSPNTPSVAKVVNSLKAVSSRRLRRQFCDIAGSFSTEVLWSRSYFAGTCGGAPLSVIKQYIEQQERPS